MSSLSKKKSKGELMYRLSDKIKLKELFLMLEARYQLMGASILSYSDNETLKSLAEEMLGQIVFPGTSWGKCRAVLCLRYRETRQLKAWRATCKKLFIIFTMTLIFGTKERLSAALLYISTKETSATSSAWLPAGATCLSTDFVEKVVDKFC